jgi:hypothetical protein
MGTNGQLFPLTDNTDGSNYSQTFLCDLPWFIIEIGLHKTGGR